ncbi:MAG TPA: pyridoxal-phosphate dependent enzyme [Pseudonocardiaceae bacterium]
MNPLVRLPRMPLGTLPTPLRPAPALSAELGVPVWFKRDDLTGMGLGGNKVRPLEYLIGHARALGCDSLVTGAGPQSNWAMLAALAARRAGLEPHLVYYGTPVPATGNLLLAERIGAEIHYTGNPDRASVDVEITDWADKLRASGHRPYVLPRGGATAIGSLGYLRASLELAGQLLDNDLTPTELWLATGSCGTQAGLVAGARWLQAPYRVVGVSVSRPVTECRRRITDLAAGVADLLGPAGEHQAPPGDPAEDITVLSGYLGPGYGQASEAGEAAADLVARTEGVFLDPVFGAKAMAALIAWAGRTPRPDGPVLFLVSGGAPTLFARGEP